MGSHSRGEFLLLPQPNWAGTRFSKATGHDEVPAELFKEGETVHEQLVHSVQKKSEPPIDFAIP